MNLRGQADSKTGLAATLVTEPIWRVTASLRDPPGQADGGQNGARRFQMRSITPMTAERCARHRWGALNGDKCKDNTDILASLHDIAHDAARISISPNQSRWTYRKVVG